MTDFDRCGSGEVCFQEIVDGVCDFLWVFEQASVCGVGQEHELGAGNLVVHVSREAFGGEDVTTAGDDQGRDVDGGQDVFGGVLLGEDAHLGPGGAVDGFEVVVEGLHEVAFEMVGDHARPAVEAVREGRVAGVERKREGLVGQRWCGFFEDGKRGAPDFWVKEVVEGASVGAQKRHQAEDAVGGLSPGFKNNLAAERKTGEDGAVDLSGVEHAQEVVGAVGDAGLGEVLGGAGASVSFEVPDDGSVAVVEVVSQKIPVKMGGCVPVGKDDGQAMATGFPCEGGAVGRERESGVEVGGCWHGNEVTPGVVLRIAPACHADV